MLAATKPNIRFRPAGGKSVVGIDRLGGNLDFLAVNVSFEKLSFVISIAHRPELINLGELQYKCVDERGIGLEYKVPESPPNLTQILPENPLQRKLPLRLLIPSLDRLKVIN